MKQVKRQLKFKRRKWYKSSEGEIFITRLFSNNTDNKECIIFKSTLDPIVIENRYLNRTIDQTALYLLMPTVSYYKMIERYNIIFEEE